MPEPPPLIDSFEDNIEQKFITQAGVQNQFPKTPYLPNEQKCKYHTPFFIPARFIIWCSTSFFFVWKKNERLKSKEH